MRISDWSSDVCSSDLFNRMIYIEDEIEKRTKLFAPRNPKADAPMWRTKTKLLEERAAKRRKMEADAEAQPTCPPPIPFAPSILGYVPPTTEEKGKEKKQQEDRQSTRLLKYLMRIS